jgi:hypothetical protein
MELEKEKKGFEGKVRKEESIFSNFLAIDCEG